MLPEEDPSVRAIPTILVGVIGGILVGITSVGSGSLIMVALLLLYPTLSAVRLVGTDLVQAVPLVASASLGHLLFGDFALGLTGSILVGAIPGFSAQNTLIILLPLTLTMPVDVALAFMVSLYCATHLGGGIPAPQEATRQTNGNGILDHIFGGNQTQVAKEVSQNTGLDMGQVAQLLITLAPIVMGYLGQKKQQEKVKINN